MRVCEETVARLRLHLVPGMGPQRSRALLRAFGSAREAWRAGPKAWGEIRGIGPALVTAASCATREKALREIERLQALGGWIVTEDDADYPELLRLWDDGPLVLFGRGRLPRGPALAVVGTRRPTPAGKRVAFEISRELASAGAVIVSGLAAGIDSAAHEGALAAEGLTVAVLAHGLDFCYPPGHRPLMERIAGSGAVVTEFPLGTRPRPGFFPSRNRIIAGMTLGTLVVEAGLRSGAMITATLAAQRGREVFAVPGDVTRWASRGPHQLLREGAWLTESAADIWAVLPALAAGIGGGGLSESVAAQVQVSPARSCRGEGRGEPFAGQEPLQARFLQALASDAGVSVDSLAQASGETPQRVLSRLGQWELLGWVERDEAGRYRLGRRLRNGR